MDGKMDGRMGWRARRVCLGAAMMLALAGCSSLQVEYGYRTGPGELYWNTYGDSMGDPAREGVLWSCSPRGAGAGDDGHGWDWGRRREVGR